MPRVHVVDFSGARVGYSGTFYSCGGCGPGDGIPEIISAVGISLDQVNLNDCANWGGRSRKSDSDGGEDQEEEGDHRGDHRDRNKTPKYDRLQTAAPAHI